MASLSMQTEQQERHRVLEDHEMDAEGAVLDQAVAVQLIAKTTSLSISGLGNEPEDLPGSGNSPCSPDLVPAETTHPQALSLPSHVQPYAATTEEWRDGASRATSAMAPAVLTSASCSRAVETTSRARDQADDLSVVGMTAVAPLRSSPRQLFDLPNELLLHILGYLEVCDLLAISRTSHHLRHLSLTPYIHLTRLRRTRALLPPLLASPSRPSRLDLIRRSIFLTHTAFASRRLAHNLASIRLARHLASRPSAEALVERCVLPPECLPSPAKGGGGFVFVAPALVARKRAVERERVKDGLRGWVGSVWRGEVRVREEGVRMWEERAGVGRVWRMRRYWERVGRGEI